MAYPGTNASISLTKLGDAHLQFLFSLCLSSTPEMTKGAAQLGMTAAVASWEAR